MPSFIPFDEVKAKVSFTDAIQYLDLAMKKSGNQWRGVCPKCGGQDRGLVLTEGRGAYCFSEKKGGDVIWLAGHVLKLAPKEAAQHLAERAGLVEQPTTRSRTVPESEEGERGLSPLSYLEPDHELVVALGFDPEFCKRQGIGYAPRGVCRGSVAIPFRDERGVLLGYLAVEDLTYIPPDFQTNVVPFKKQA